MTEYEKKNYKSIYEPMRAVMPATIRKDGKNKEMTWREFIEKERKLYTGRKVKYENKIYTVVDVDYNGVILINKHGEFTPETAIGLPPEVNFID